jgi:uncharacterized protein (TIGR02246 family)
MIAAKPQPQASPFNDEAAVRALYELLMEGWNRGSSEAFAAPFAEDADFIAFDGSHLKGREEIASFHRPLFATHLKGTHLIGRVKNIRILSSGVALIHAVGGTVKRGKAGPAPERNSIQTLVATKCGIEWRFAAFQNTRVRPIGRNAGGTFVWLFSDWLWKLFRPKN